MSPLLFAAANMPGLAPWTKPKARVQVLGFRVEVKRFVRTSSFLVGSSSQAMTARVKARELRLRRRSIIHQSRQRGAQLRGSPASGAAVQPLA